MGDPVCYSGHLALSFPGMEDSIRGKLTRTIGGCCPGTSILVNASATNVTRTTVATAVLSVPVKCIHSNRGSRNERGRVRNGLRGNRGIIIVRSLVSANNSILRIISILHRTNTRILKVVSVFACNLRGNVSHLTTTGMRGRDLSSFNALIGITTRRNCVGPRRISGLRTFVSGPDSPT